jgi:hypothetical protein
MGDYYSYFPSSVASNKKIDSLHIAYILASKTTVYVHNLPSIANKIIDKTLNMSKCGYSISDIKEIYKEYMRIVNYDLSYIPLINSILYVFKGRLICKEYIMEQTLYIRIITGNIFNHREYLHRLHLEYDPYIPTEDTIYLCFKKLLMTNHCPDFIIDDYISKGFNISHFHHSLTYEDRDKLYNNNTWRKMVRYNRIYTVN